MIILEIKKEIWEVDKFIMTRKQMVAKLFKNKKCKILWHSNTNLTKFHIFYPCLT